MKARQPLSASLVVYSPAAAIENRLMLCRCGISATHSWKQQPEDVPLWRE
jgi:hypothetical protein